MSLAPATDPPAKPRRKRKKNNEFWRACGFLGPYRKWVVIAIASAFISGVLLTIGMSAMLPIIKVLLADQTVQGWIGQQMATHAVVPWYLRVAYNVAGLLPRNKVGVIAVLFCVILVLAMAGNVFRFCHEYLSDHAAISAINDIRRRLYDHVLHLPLNYFGRFGTSDVTSRLVQDAQGLQDGFKTILGQAIAEPIKAGMTFTLALIIDWRLTIFIVVFAPLMLSVIRKFGKKVRRASRAALQNSAHMLGQIEGTLVGIRVVKSNTAERFERRRYKSIMHGLFTEQLKMAKYEAISTPVLETLAMLVVGCVLIFASYLVFEIKDPSQRLSQASFLVVLACLVTIGESLRRLSKLNNVLQRSNAAAARIFELLDTPVERARVLTKLEKSTKASRATRATDRPVANEGDAVLRTLKRGIGFYDISFQYPNTQHPALSHVTLDVAKGQSVAIVGRNGSGKTTLLSLLPRFFEPTGGRILIDDVDVRDFTLPSLRRQIGIVTQDPIVFPGTIAQNIAYGHPMSMNLGEDGTLPPALQERVEAAARQAFADEFIQAKPQGYDTRLDGLGSQLSGGQKQRLNIARAILRDTPILILDEATSQVDAESEHLIQQAIEELMHHRTTFVIAHRFSTIKAADTIVVMEQGEIVGQGKHAELLETCEIYRKLNERQM